MPVFNYVPGYLLHCSDEIFFQYLRELEYEKENISYELLQAKCFEVLEIMHRRNKNNIQPLSDATMSYFSRQLCERLHVMQE